MIVAQEQLASVVPTEPASMCRAGTSCSGTRKTAPDMGLIKVDLLGLGMMAVLKDGVELIPH